MNRAEMRAMLKDCLQEPQGAETDYWSIPALNALLNRALLAIEMKVIRINPTAFMQVDTFAQVANKNLYPIPPGCIAIRKVLCTRTGKRLRLQSDGYMDVTYGAGVGENLQNVTTGQDPRDYVPFGRYIRVGPTPNVARANAISIAYTASLTMAEDTDVPQLVESLHDAVVNKAWVLGLRPTADIGQIAAASRALDQSLEDFDDLAGVPVDSAIQVIPDFDPIDGLYGEVSASSEVRS